MGLLDKLIKAYHGSKADFDRFDFSHMGSGEGAQAYSWGGYVSKDDQVADEYRRMLSGNDEVLFGGKPLSSYLPPDAPRLSANMADALANQTGGDRYKLFAALADRQRQDAGRQLPSLQRNAEAFRGLLDVVDNMKQSDITTKRRGHLYEVGLDVDPHLLIDWQKPLGEQFKVMQYAGNDIQDVVDTISKRRSKGSGETVTVNPEEMLGKEFYRGVGEVYQNRLNAAIDDINNELSALASNPKGNGERYLQLLEERDVLRSAFMNPYKGATEKLRDAGIEGVTYMGEYNRTGGKGARNYVAFNEDQMKILKKYGLIGTPMGGILGQLLGQEQDNGMR